MGRGVVVGSLLVFEEHFFSFLIPFLNFVAATVFKALSFAVHVVEQGQALLNYSGFTSEMGGQFEESGFELSKSVVLGVLQGGDDVVDSGVEDILNMSGLNYWLRGLW